MCGIAGFLATGSALPGEGLLRAMGDSMRHRGPDASGTHLSPDGRVGLSHRRLSIIDLSETGAQPMFSSDGSLVLSFNGEVFNYRELREELSGRGHVFRGGSDTEVMLAAFREWGVDAAVRRFIGMFAFALWDTRAQTIPRAGPDRDQAAVPRAAAGDAPVRIGA
jgi:asparagine synthase (glutamine-hydrolysing)